MKRKRNLQSPTSPSNGEQFPIMRGKKQREEAANLTQSASLLEAGGSGQAIMASSITENETEEESSPCAFCDETVGLDAIGCDFCKRWYHPSNRCTGLKPATILAIVDEGGDAIKFMCTVCRVAPTRNSTLRSSTSTDGDDWKVAVGQVHELVRSLSLTVSRLVGTVDKMVENSSNNLTPPPQLVPSSRETLREESSREDLYNELWEFEERKKRASSVIVKGISCSNLNEFSDKFCVVYQFLVNSAPNLTNVTCINRDTKMYRVTFAEKVARVNLLREAKNLKDSEHKDVYISRDLTWVQRTELKAKRAARRAQAADNTSGEHGGSGPPLSDANSIPLSQGNHETSASASGVSRRAQASGNSQGEHGGMGPPLPDANPPPSSQGNRSASASTRTIRNGAGARRFQ